MGLETFRHNSLTLVMIVLNRVLFLCFFVFRGERGERGWVMAKGNSLFESDSKVNILTYDFFSLKKTSPLTTLKILDFSQNVVRKLFAKVWVEKFHA